jgi:hydrogenase nickel incorporation protein HypB
MCGLCGCGDAEVIAAPAPRVIQLQADVLRENVRCAARNREHFRQHGVLALNFVSSPGSGKTTLLCSVIARLRQRAPGVEVAVIEGDQQTSRDAERIRALGVAAVQINTGKGCHLDAAAVGSGFGRLALHARGQGGILFIENVGNLVCPALWDLGERAKVVVVSVTEGEDKPLKYPDMFAASSLMVVNKIDLLPYVCFDVEACAGYARRVNPALEVVRVSATRGDGVSELVDWMLRADAASQVRSESAP